MCNQDIIKLRDGRIIDLKRKVPLMFQAQVKGRCQLQREGDNRQSPIYEWAEEWTENYPQNNSSSSPKPQPKKKQTIQNLALQRPAQKKETGKTADQKSAKFEIKPPQFPKNYLTYDWKEYTIDWRLVTDSGIDDIIRPIIGAKGYPYYSGTSMKGAFRRACDNKEKIYDHKTKTQAEYYCGKDADKNNNSQPAILRFHGGYPIDNSWTQNLVDLVHPQQEKQVIEDETTNAVKQIALHNVTLRFGISSTKKLDETEWNKIWKIWEKALGYGLGSRVTAGYGRFQKKLDDGTFQRIDVQEELVSIDIKGQGIASTLTDRDKTPEFRPNMFKAALRGHTLRLLGGITDEDTAKQLTNILWGGIENGATFLGLLGVAFEYDSNKPNFRENYHRYVAKIPKKTQKNSQHKSNQKPEYFEKQVKMSLFDLKKGTLKVFLMHSNLSSQEQQELRDIAIALIRFTMLFGGFGKSWRRVHHKLFYPSYLNGEKPMIGCHWEFINNPNFLKLSDSGDNLKERIVNFINDIRKKLTNWARQKVNNLEGTTASNWRESWYSDHVKVYGRIANHQDKSQASKAVYWFHQPYHDNQKIKKTSLTGGLGQTGRIWHRMYPYGENKYVELLTIFPDNSEKFIDFLKNKAQSDFQHIW